MVIIVLGVSVEPFPGTWCGFDSLEARSALEVVWPTSQRQRAHRPDYNAGWSTAGRQGKAGEGIVWGHWPHALLL